MDEEWKTIPGYEGIYQASNLGRIRSLPRKNRRGNKISPRILKLISHRQGYLRVHLFKGDSSMTFQVHRLVMMTFVGDGKGYEVNHRNGNPADNRLENLEYVTRLENVRHSIDVLNRGLIGNRNGRAKLTETDIPKIDSLLEQGMCHRKIACIFNVSETSIRNVYHRTYWKHIPRNNQQGE